MNNARTTSAPVLAAILAATVALAGIAAPGVATAQTAAPPIATAPTPAVKSSKTPEPSTAARIENWTKKQWDAAKKEWAKDSKKWTDCQKDSDAQKLSGRKSWSFLYQCMAA